MLYILRKTLLQLLQWLQHARSQHILHTHLLQLLQWLQPARSQHTPYARSYCSDCNLHAVNTHSTHAVTAVTETRTQSPHILHTLLL
jgi:hypothetical protein